MGYSSISQRCFAYLVRCLCWSQVQWGLGCSRSLQVSIIGPPTISGVQWSCLVVKDVFLKTLFLCTYRRSCLPALSLLDLVDGIGIGYLVSVVVLVLSCWFTHYLFISCAHGLCLLLLGTYINTFILFLPLKQNIYIGIGYLVSVVVLVLSCWFMHYLYISCAHGLCLLLLLGAYINTKLYICQRNSELR